MSAIFNIAKGRIVELYKRVVSNDPANSALILVPLETSGLEDEASLIVKDDLAAVLSGSTNEQTTMGRKTLTDSDLAALPAPDDTNNRYEVSLPNVTWSAASGNAISQILVCYDNDTTGGSDSNIVPLVLLDNTYTPDGSDATLAGGVFHRAG